MRKKTGMSKRVVGKMMEVGMNVNAVVDSCRYLLVVSIG